MQYKKGSDYYSNPGEHMLVTLVYRSEGIATLTFWRSGSNSLTLDTSVYDYPGRAFQQSINNDRGNESIKTMTDHGREPLSYKSTTLWFSSHLLFVEVCS